MKPDVHAVLLDGLGTLVALEPPGPALIEVLRRERGIELACLDAERAFRAEMDYYRAHHHEGRDEGALQDLRRRCAEVLHDELPFTIGAALAIAELQAAMLQALHFSPYPDAHTALKTLRDRGMRLVVVSNWDVSLSSVLNGMGLSVLLDGVVTSAAIGAPKPARAIFEAALELACVPAQQAVHVGDSVKHDVAGAQAAGIAPVLLSRMAIEPAELPPGVPTIASLAELPALLA